MVPTRRIDDTVPRPEITTILELFCVRPESKYPPEKPVFYLY
jgi:hypothetical protein